jgi:hypothetical protein
MHALALLYEYGSGVPQDLEKAIALYEQAVELHQAESMFNLALMYASGRGVPLNYIASRALFEKAAQLEHAPSVYYIGVFKTYGYGCDVNYEQAIHWFERAAHMDDSRVSRKAHEAATELRVLLERAYKENEERLAVYRRRAMDEH